MAVGKRIKAVANIPSPATATTTDVANKVNELLAALRESDLQEE